MEQRNGYIKDDDIVVAFCNPRVAAGVSATNPDFVDALVVSSYIPDDEVIVVKKDEFLDWLYEKKEEEENERNIDARS